MSEETTSKQAADGRAVQPIYQGESKSLFISALELFFSRWIVICAIFFSATFWSFYALVRAPDSYQATGQVLIRRGNIEAVRAAPILRQAEEVQSEVDILKSITVLDEVVTQLLNEVDDGLPEDRGGQPLIFGSFESTRPDIEISTLDLPTTDRSRLFKMLEDRLSVRKFGESNVIEIALVSGNPRFSAAVVNVLIDVYEKYDLSEDQTPGQTAFFRRAIAQIDAEIDGLQTELATLLEDLGVVEPEKERELLSLRRHALLMELDDLLVDKVGVEADLRKVARTTTVDTPFMRKDESIKNIRARLFYERAALAKLRSQHQADNPIVVAKLEEVDELQQTLEEEQMLAVAQQEHLLDQMLQKQRQIEGTIADIDKMMALFPRLAVDIDRLKRNIIQQTIARNEVVEQMFKSATIATPDESLNKVRVLGYASVPPAPREARKGFKFSVAVVLSAIAAFVAAVFVEGLDHTVRRRDEIEAKLHVPYLASLGPHGR